MPVSLLRRIRALPGVADAQGQISDVATIVGRNGKVISSTGSRRAPPRSVPAAGARGSPPGWRAC
jgi:hypothetical protein